MYSFPYLEPVCCSMSSSNCCFLTCIQISQEADQVVWYSHLFQNFPQFIVMHTVKGFGIVNKAEIDVFLELSCFFNDPVDVGNLTSGSSGLQGDPTSPSWRKSVLNVHWKEWYGSWNYNTLATWCEELTHWKRPWWLKAGGEGDDKGWDGWMASLTQWTWVWVNSRNWWWTGRPGVLWSMGSQTVGHDWVTELNWMEIHSQKQWESSLEYKEFFKSLFTQKGIRREELMDRLGFSTRVWKFN